MDPDQLREIVQVISESQQGLIEGIITKMMDKLQISQSGQTIGISNNIPPFEEFNPKTEKFKNYLERFENYLAVRNVKDLGKKAQLLSVSIGSVHYNNLSALLGPEVPIKNLDYLTLCKHFSEMLSPHKNSVVSQHYFLCTYQKQNQSIPEFVASLQKNITECEFNVKCECSKQVSAADILLRAQFIRGLKDNWIREQLLQMDETSFKEVVMKATALEASRLEVQELSKHQVTNTPSSDVDINKVSKKFTDDAKFPSKSRQFQSSKPKRYTPKSKSKISFEQLGINGLCLRCGRNNHRASECRSDRSSLHCKACSRHGHVSKVCVTSLMKEKFPRTEISNVASGSSAKFVSTSRSEDFGFNYINHNSRVIDIYDNSQSSKSRDSQKYTVTVLINDRPMQFEVDSGAGYTLISETDFNKLDLKVAMSPTDVFFRSYTNDIFHPKGKVQLKVSYNGNQSDEELYIVPEGHPAVLGRVWIRHLGINLQEIDRAQNVFSSSDGQVHSIDDVLKDFSDVFEQKIGCLPNHKVTLKLRENATPVYTRERNVPFALRSQVEEELNNLESAGIISKTEVSDWGSPLVVIPKDNGKVRLCVDYKTGVNDRLVSANFPIKHIPDILNSLRNSRVFCKLDIFKAYLHIPVDEESSKIQTITTHRGTYRMHRLSFGIKTAPAEFNRILGQILQGLPKVEAYFDDIIVHGSTKDECLQNLVTCLQRLQENDIHLNKDKCVFFCETIEYLGHVIQFNKVSKSPEKIRAINEMPRPRNVDDVRRFLGMVTYYARFIPDLSTKSTPLRDLLQKNRKFNWSRRCESAFQCLKKEITSDRVLVPYDPHQPIVLTCDASPTGIAAVMSHIINNEERPIAYASRSLTSSEKNYSQLDREALSIVFGVSHFYNYLFGLHFELVTDNAPLSRIFHEKKTLPPMTSSRLLRYASFLSGFNYSIRFKKGESNVNVDCLSRAPINQETNTVDVLLNNEVNLLHSNTLFQISSEILTPEVLARETERDQDLNKIKQDLQNKSEESPYTLSDGVLFKDNRAVIPKSLYNHIF